MAKSIRSKIKKRFRTAKRQRIEAMMVRPRTQEKHEALQRVIRGQSVTLSTPKNAFKYPNEDGAVFPQHEVVKPIDFRAQSLPMAGFAFRGNRRKYGDNLEVSYLQDIAKNHHPEMEVLAGGGAILAKTGQRVSMTEAQLVATQVERPEAAAVFKAATAAETAAAAVAAAAKPPSGASAATVTITTEASPVAGVADAARAGGADVEMEADEAENDGDAVDHSRRPVMKATGRKQTTRLRKGAKERSGLLKEIAGDAAASSKKLVKKAAGKTKPATA